MRQSTKGKKIGNRKGRVAGLAKARRVRASKLREAKRVEKAGAVSTAQTLGSAGSQWAVPVTVSVREDTTKPEPHPVGLSLPVSGAFRLLLGEHISLARDIDGGLTLAFPSNLTVSLKA